MMKKSRTVGLAIVLGTTIAATTCAVIAASNTPPPREPWRDHFVSKSGHDFMRFMVNEEGTVIEITHADLCRKCVQERLREARRESEAQQGNQGTPGVPR